MFAALLLVWTAVDLLDYGVCTHHHERVGGLVDTAFRAASGQEASPPHGFDDCFCCSHVVDVRIPFRITLEYAIVWTLEDRGVFTPAPDAPPLLHPPLG